MADSTNTPKDDAPAAKPSADPRAPENNTQPPADTPSTPNAPAAPAPAENKPAAPAEDDKPAAKSSAKASDDKKSDQGEKQKTVRLNFEFANNTPDGLIKYGPGEVTVDEGIADDLLRRNDEQLAYRESVHVKDESLLNAGTISGGGQ